MKKWSAFVFLFASCIAIPTAQAGLLGDLVGAAVAHHEEQQQKQDGQQTLLTAHPILGTVAGATAGGVAEGAIIHEAKVQPLLALAGGAVAGLAADNAGRNYLEKHDCSSENPPYWSCPGIPGQHILPVEARDLYIEARTEKLRKNMAAAGEDIPPKGSHCAAHHIVPVEHESSPLFEESRNILKECGIDINSAENGVFLPDSRKPSSFCAGRTYHRDLHTNLYARKLFLKLNDAMENDGCDGVHKALQEIKQDLKDGVSWR